MLRTLRKIALPLILGSSLVSFADENLDVDYFEDEGRLLFKVRAFGIIGAAKTTGLPKALSNSPSPISSFLKNGYGGDTATTIFVNDNIAAELSLGLQVYNVTKNHFAQIANNYNGDVNAVGKRKNLLSIPLALTLQYHLAPFGAIRPYAGGGYHVDYLITKSKNFKPGRAHGPVAQIGADFVSKDDTLITFDVRKIFSNSTITYKGPTVNGQGFKGKIKNSPVVVSVGIGFKF